MDAIAQDRSTGNAGPKDNFRFSICYTHCCRMMDKLRQSWHPYLNEPVGNVIRRVVWQADGTVNGRGLSVPKEHF